MAPLRLHRRSFLRLAGGSAALATLAQVPSLPLAATRSSGRFFSDEETEWLTQIVERLVFTGEPHAPPLRETRAIQTIDRLCAGLDPALTEPLPLLLRLIEYGPFFFELRFSRFTAMEDEEKDASLRGWMESRFEVRRMGFLALRNLAFLGFYSDDKTWPLIGYQGPLLAPRS